jgi:hypothetical protein
LVTGHGADHIVLPEGVHNGHAAFAIVATISLFTRCTVPLPAPTIVASQRMPFQAAQVLPDGVLDLWGHLGRQELPALLAHTLQPDDEHCAVGIRLLAKRPPGRGVEDGETFEQAAILLEEETGIRVKDVGVEAARREVVFVTSTDLRHGLVRESVGTLRAAAFHMCGPLLAELTLAAQWGLRDRFLPILG